MKFFGKDIASKEIKEREDTMKVLLIIIMTLFLTTSCTQSSHQSMRTATVTKVVALGLDLAEFESSVARVIALGAKIRLAKAY